MFKVLIDYGSEGHRWLTENTSNVVAEFSTANEALKGFLGSYAASNKFEILKTVDWEVIEK